MFSLKNSSSARPSLISTCIIASASAPSVPGFIRTVSSQYFFMASAYTSISITRFPSFLALIISGMDCILVAAIFEPHTIYKSPFPISRGSRHPVFPITDAYPTPFAVEHRVFTRPRAPILLKNASPQFLCMSLITPE